MGSPLTVGILIFDEVEVLDYCGPFEVFSVTSLHKPSTFTKVVLIGEKDVITTRGGMNVAPHYLIGGNDIPQIDVLLIPGGYGTRTQANNQKLLDWLKEIGTKVRYFLSVCTGVSLLGKMGLLDGKVITTHHLAYDEVLSHSPNSIMCQCRRFIDNDPVFVSAGISAGIDLSLYFVKKLYGKDVALATAKFMEYDWKDVDISRNLCNCETEGKKK